MQFLSLHIYAGKYGEFLENIKNPKRNLLVFTPNPEILLRASRDEEFLDFLKKADYLTPDGNGLYVSSLMQDQNMGFFRACLITFFSKTSVRKKYGELIRGSQLTADLVQYAIMHKKRVLMIDNYRITTPKNEFEVQKQELQSKFQELFHEKLPGLDMTVLFDGESSPEQIAQLIESQDIEYVFSCIGMKLQEQRLVEIFSYLPSYLKVVGLGVGSSFDYLLGLQKRAPVLFQKLGLEWFYRLLQDPRRRMKRILDAVYYFPKNITR